MPGPERVVASRPDAPWLPPGGRADVVRAGAGTAVPQPVGLLRLLVTRGGDLLAVPRRHGSGRDLPTTQGDLRRLVTETLGADLPTTLLGWVHNHVPAPTDDYEWPAPDAYFVVWHVDLPPERKINGA